MHFVFKKLLLGISQYLAIYRNGVHDILDIGSG